MSDRPHGHTVDVQRQTSVAATIRAGKVTSHAVPHEMTGSAMAVRSPGCVVLALRQSIRLQMRSSWTLTR